MTITYKEEFNLNDLRFSDVIDGLNKYFAEDETRVQVPSSFVEVQTLVSSISIKGFNKIIPIRFDAEMYLDKLISWLRTEHGIFYYLGMEAKYAKAEKRIPPFTERMMDEGALNSLKKLHKLVTGEEPEVDSHTLIAAVIETDFAVLKQDLKNALEAKESFFETKGKLNYREELMEHIVKTEKKYGICFSDLHDDEEFRPECVFDDLVEALKKSEAELATLKEQNEILKGEVRQLNREHIAALDRIEKLNAELADKLSTEIWEVNNKRWNDLHDIYKALGCDRSVNGHVDEFAKAVKALATCIKSERDIAQTKLNAIEKKLEELLKDIKEELP